MWSRWLENRRMRRYRFERSDWERCVAWWPPAAAVSGPLREQWFDLVKRFLLRKSIVGGAGFEVTDDMRWTVASMATLPVLGRGLQLYRGWEVVVLYETQFCSDLEHEDEHGVVHRDEEWRSGEAWEQGPVILSWEDVQGASSMPPYNVVIHEMAHKIDLLTGSANGAPPLPAGVSAQHWQQVMAAAMAELAQWERDGDTGWLDPYALEHPAEFFAVLAEVFFEAPQALVQQWPQVYAALAGCFRLHWQQDRWEVAA